jgi:hypothetical protein
LGNIVKLSLWMIGLLLAASGFEELFRSDPASSHVGGVIFLACAVGLLLGSRAVKRVPENPTISADTFGGNQVVARALEKRSGQIGAAVFATGAVMAIAGAATEVADPSGQARLQSWPISRSI